MQTALEDHQKRRLVNRAEIELAIAWLQAQGHQEPDLLVEMLKSFHIDLDEFDAATRRAA